MAAQLPSPHWGGTVFPCPAPVLLRAGLPQCGGRAPRYVRRLHRARRQVFFHLDLRLWSSARLPALRHDLGDSHGYRHSCPLHVALPTTEHGGAAACADDL
eukprot:1649190-Pyramimonas_sp.AAC.1